MKINKMKGIHKELGPQKLKHQPRCGHGSWGDLRTLHKHTKISTNHPNQRIHKELRPPKLKHQPRCGHGSWGDLRTLHEHTKMNENQKIEKNP